MLWNFKHVNKFESNLPIFIGVPLEMSQKDWIGSAKVALIFFSGVILGSMGSGVFEKFKLEGSSAGTYALITAHLGMYLNLILKYINSKHYAILSIF